MVLEQLQEALPDRTRCPEDANPNLPHRCSLTHRMPAASIEHTYNRSARGALPRIAATLNKVLKSDGPRRGMPGLFCFPKEQAMRASVTVRVAGAAAAAALLDLKLGPPELAELASELEGHPDNVAPAVFGGATLVLRDPDGLIVTPLPIHPSLALVFAVPDFTVETKRARAALPATLPHADAVRAAAKSAALIHGLAHADPRLLAAGLDDVLHVPFRRALVPGYDEVTKAARDAGAYGATLSGSGPTIVAVVPAHGVRAVGDAMVRTWEARGTVAEAFHADRPAGGFEI